MLKHNLRISFARRRFVSLLRVGEGPVATLAGESPSLLVEKIPLFSTRQREVFSRIIIVVGLRQWD